MKKETFECSVGESYVKATHSSGLEIYVMEKPEYSSAYAVFGTKYGSIDTKFEDKDVRTVCVPEGYREALANLTRQ